MKFTGQIENLPDWDFISGPEIAEILHPFIAKSVAEALNNTLPDSGSIWITEGPLGIRFYLNLSDTVAEVEWTRPLSEAILEHVESHYFYEEIGDDERAAVAEISNGLRAIADQVDALLAEVTPEQNEAET